MHIHRNFSIAVWAAYGFTTACGNSSGRNSDSPSRPANGGTRDAPHAREPRSQGSPSHPERGDAGSPVSVRSPSKVSGNDPCVLSADCPSGQHCDLGECYQECSDAEPCKSGTMCSPRGRCLAPGAADVDPPVTTSRMGTVSSDQTTIQLTERDDRLRLRLKADSKGPVHYRVELNAPYLSIDEPRGTFDGETTIDLGVHGDMTGVQDTSGSVRVITSLGSLSFSTPIRVRVTGVYQGTMTYDGTAGGPAIGTTRAGFDVIETDGDVIAQFAPDRSLLYPAVDGKKPVAGRGTYTNSDGLDVVLRQKLPKGFADADDLFQRDIGRQVRLTLKSGDRGSLDGTFEERIIGLFTTDVTLTGHAHFERKSCTDGADLCTPHVDTSAVVTELSEAQDAVDPDFSAVFAGFTDANGAPSDCTRLGSERESTLQSLEFVDFAFHQPFLETLAGTGTVSAADPLGDLADKCNRTLQLLQVKQDKDCGEIAPLACGLGVIVANDYGKDAYDDYGTLFAHTLDVPIFVAQNDLVRAVKASFVGGSVAELRPLHDGKATLKAPATWVLHPRLLEYLRRADPSWHKGKDEAPTSLAARTLSRMLLVLSTIDQETARINAGARIGKQDEMRLTAQKQGIEALLEAAALYGIASTWQSPPPELGTSFIDVLTPLDAAFTSLAQGATVFGVPEGVVPNAYDPARSPPSNFEQLADIASSQVIAAKDDEDIFTSEGRQFENDEHELAMELGQVAGTYENQVKSACGEAFDLDNPDWLSCGKAYVGVIGSKALEVEEALAQLNSAKGRIDDKEQAIQIEKDRMAQTKDVREDTIRFTANTGQVLKDLDIQEGLLNGAEKALDIASHADIFNGGAPLAEAAGAFFLEAAKGGLEADKQQTQTLQDMHVQEANLDAEEINSAAVVKGLLVEESQAKTEMQEDVIKVLSARVDAENAFSDAKRALWLRQDALNRINQSSLRDPTARVLRSRAALYAIDSRTQAQISLYRAGRALEYHLNRSIGDQLGWAVMNAFDANEEGRLLTCYHTIFDASRLALPTQQQYVTEVSIRKLLGIAGPRKDEVSGEMLTEGAQLRQVLLRNQNLDGDGGVAIDFTTTLDPGNELWASNVCDDRVAQVEAQLVGDFLGDNEAQVVVDLNGGSVFRTCDGGALMSWSTVGHAVIQAGVNTFGTATPNGSLNGLAVASSKWQVAIPGPSKAPSNADLDLTKLDDIVLRIHHQARPIPTNPWTIDFKCLDQIGSG